MNWKEVTDALAGAGLAHLATASADGRPHVSVVAPAVEGEVLWFATTASSGKARNLGANPQVALMWQPRAEIYLWGRATVVTDAETKRRLWHSGLFPFDLAGFWGTPDNPQLVFARVEPEAATVLSVGLGGLTRRRWRRPVPA